MKQNALLRLLILFCIVISGISLAASRLATLRKPGTECTEAACSNQQAQQGDVMLWQSLYQQLLAFKQ